VNKIIVISAPSGAGKTSIVHHLLDKMPELEFSISACSRKKRENEIDRKDYYFLKVQEFKNKIKENAFLEWEEVYQNQFYGTLKLEIDRIWKQEKTAIVDVDVIGGVNIKNYYLDQCLSIFIMPPSLETLKNRLIKRASESEKNLQIRLDKAEEEISKKQQFDSIILNDDFELACLEIQALIVKFISN
jgi:guanylate kinase